MSVYPIHLFDTLDTENIIDLHELLVEAAYEGSDEYLFDATALREIDAAGLQLLLYFIHDLEAAHKKVTWQHVHPHIYHQVSKLGLARVMRLA